MGVVRSGPAEQGLEQALQAGRRAEVVAAGDEGDALQGVIMGGAEHVARRGVLAGEDRVAERGRMAVDLAHALLPIGERGGEAGEGGRHVEAERVRVAAGAAGGYEAGCELAAGSGVSRRTVRAVWSLGARCGDLGTGAEAGIQQAHGLEAREGGRVFG